MLAGLKCLMQRRVVVEHPDPAVEGPIANRSRENPHMGGLLGESPDAVGLGRRVQMQTLGLLGDIGVVERPACQCRQCSGEVVGLDLAG